MCTRRHRPSGPRLGPPPALPTLLPATANLSSKRCIAISKLGAPPHCRRERSGRRRSHHRRRRHHRLRPRRSARLCACTRWQRGQPSTPPLLRGRCSTARRVGARSSQGRSRDGAGCIARASDEGACERERERVCRRERERERLGRRPCAREPTRRIGSEWSPRGTNAATLCSVRVASGGGAGHGSRSSGGDTTGSLT